MQRQVSDSQTPGPAAGGDAGPSSGLPDQPDLSNETGKAIALICLAVMCFSGNDASAKYAITVGHLPVAEVVWVRFLGQLAAIILALGLFAIPSLLRANKPGGAAPGSEGGSGAAGWLRRQ